ncbi:MAG: hypothetical protein J6Y20_11575 [Lachnospiraceae bacterium]|nr:hypothetical protein [Lachnospiraceae bacterium]
MANNKVQLKDGTVLMDLTSDTVTPSTLARGVTAHNAAGTAITGTMDSGGGGEVAEQSFNAEGHYLLTEGVVSGAEFHLPSNVKTWLSSRLASMSTIVCNITLKAYESGVYVMTLGSAVTRPVIIMSMGTDGVLRFSYIPAVDFRSNRYEVLGLVLMMGEESQFGRSYCEDVVIDSSGITTSTISVSFDLPPIE